MFKYESIELKGFKRLKLSMTNYIKVNMSEPIQLFVGTNGCGKSSLLEELSFLPPNVNDFEKDGFKRVTGIYNGFTYVAFTDYSTSPTKHSFTKDGIELNHGGTVTVQKDLVKQETKLTPEIHKLLTGSQKFTAMSPANRREWFTLFSDVSYDYAISLYNKLRERHRDTTGAIKLLKKRLLFEKSKILPDSDRESLHKEVEALYEFIQLLNDHREPVTHDPRAQYQSALQALEKARNGSMSLIKRKLKLGSINYTSTEEIEQSIQALKNSSSVTQQLLQHEVEEFTTLSSTVKELEVHGYADESSLLQSIEQKTKEIKESRGHRQVLKEIIEDPASMLNAFDSVLPSVEAILQEIATNDQGQFTPTSQELANMQLTELNTQLLKVQNKISTVKASISHQEAHRATEMIECVQCKHKWNYGFKEAVYVSLKEDLAKLSEEEYALLSKQTTLASQLKEIETYLTLYKNFFAIVRAWPVLSPLWTHLVENRFILNNPARALQECSLFMRDVKDELVCYELNMQIQSLRKTLDFKRLTGETSIATLILKKEELELSINKRTVAVTALQTSINTASTLLKEINSMQKASEEIEATVKLATELQTLATENLRKATLQSTIREVQSILARREDLLNSANLQKGIIEDLESQLTILQFDDESLKTLVEELSPSNGLIAEGLTGFINHYIAQVNIFIRRIWAYPLNIVACQLEDSTKVELDYKFPMQVATKDNKVSDVSLGSTGMKEVVDLAFVVTAMKYLGLSEGPIYLDEMGASLDSVHKESTVNMIKSLTEKYMHSQVFLISHDFYQYGALPNAQMCVLNKDNVIIPEHMHFNQHVTMS